MKINRGEIWSVAWTGFARKPRPALVIQAEEYRLTETDILALITTTENEKSGKRLGYSTEYLSAVHNIWTPIMHNIQKKIYSEKSKIITAKDDEIFFIKNAALTIEQKEGTGRKSWGTNTALMKRLESTKNDIEKHNPQLVISFGAFAFEFMRRCYIQDEKKWHNMNNWTTKKLGEAFNENIAKNDPLIPLLHVSIYRYWHICSKVFTADTTTESPLYFEYVAERLYKRFIAVLNM